MNPAGTVNAALRAPTFGHHHAPLSRAARGRSRGDAAGPGPLPQRGGGIRMLARQRGGQGPRSWRRRSSIVTGAWRSPGNRGLITSDTPLLVWRTPGPPGDLGLADRRGRRPGPRPDLLHPRSTHRAPHRHRDGGHSPSGLAEHLPDVLAAITRKRLPKRRHRTCPRAVKRARHNNYRVKKPDEPAGTRHHGPATIRLHTLNPRAA